ncbi:unnamed protein product [Rotaria sp. Silwood2]|nr:unnamed protein product [Rotaria sp. Silwood2]CAF4094827.1 unnamed protein product [Rotaria sp. Silwood2]
MEFDNEQTKNNKTIILQRSCQKKKIYYLDDNNNDCLTDTFITMYRSSIWCIKFIYELFFVTLWQVLSFAKDEIHYSQNDTTKSNKSLDIMSLNNSAKENYSEKIYRKLPRHHLSMIETNNQESYQHQLLKSNSCEKISSNINLLSNNTRITVRSISNQNLNRAQSNHTPSTEQKNRNDTLGVINSHVIVAPVHSSHCQNITTKNNFREQLANTLCHYSYEPIRYMKRGMCCEHCRPLFFPYEPCYRSEHYFTPCIPQKQMNSRREFSQKSKQSPQIGETSESQPTPYSGMSLSPSVQSHLTKSPEDEPLSTGTISHNENNEQNPSILSFPDHDSSPSQESEQFIDNDNQLKVDAQIFVDESIQNAQEKYQRILRMSIDQDPQNTTLDIVKPTNSNKPKSVVILDESNTQKLSNENTLCQELCNKLNLSDSNQITEIIHILALNAPHILKEQNLNKNILINNINTSKNSENTLCKQLLLHPPFKPKRLIHLCPDGSIQVLSAVDDNSNENQIINQQSHHLNYSNSALPPSMQQNHIFTGKFFQYIYFYESSLLLEYETTATTTLDLKTNSQSHSKNEIHFDHLIIDNNSIVSLQQQKTIFKYDSSLEYTSKHPSELQLNSNHSKIVSEDNDPIVRINLDLQDEMMELNNKDDENSLSEIFFKRIIAQESKYLFIN